MASTGHELCSPPHELAEYLTETAANTYEAGLVPSIITCGKILLDHVLDHKRMTAVKNMPKQDKNDGKETLPGHLSTPNTMEPLVLVDLSALVGKIVATRRDTRTSEQELQKVWAGQAVRRMAECEVSKDESCTMK